MTQHQRIGETAAARSLPDQDIAPAYAAGAHANQHLIALRCGRRVDVAEDQNVGSEAVPSVTTAFMVVRNSRDRLLLPAWPHHLAERWGNPERKSSEV